MNIDKNLTIAENVLKLVGGKENIKNVFYCATRLRFELKDVSKVDEAALKKTNGVLGVTNAGGMYQVIVGSNVEQVYDHLCSLGDFKKSSVIDENLDPEVTNKDKGFSFKKLADSVIKYFVESMTPIINIMIGAALWYAIVQVLGPSILNVISADSGFYLSGYYIYRAFFYFLPIYMGFTAAKAMKITNPVWGAVIGGLTIVPEFIALSTTMTTFPLFGFLNVPVADYGASVLPVILGVWVFKYLYNFLKKVIPSLVFSLVAPVIALFVMTILMLGVFAPLGTWVGTLISDVLLAMAGSAWPLRLIATIILTAIWPFITLMGMHLPIAFAIFAVLGAGGNDPFGIACMNASIYCLYGIALGAVFKFKKPENKNTAISACITAFFGGICEPCIYGVGLKSKSATRMLLVAGAVSGIVVFILHPVCYTISAGASIFNMPVAWSGADAANITAGVLMDVICCAIGALTTILFIKFDEDKS